MLRHEPPQTMFEEERLQQIYRDITKYCPLHHDSLPYYAFTCP